MIDIPSLTEQETRDMLMSYVAKAKSGMVFVEVGSFVGGTICCMAQKAKELDKNIEIYAVDTWSFDNISAQSKEFARWVLPPYEQFQANLEKCGVTNLIKVLTGDSIKVSQQFADKSIDFIFIDGDHSANYIENELNAWLPKMKDNSIISGHDYKNSDSIKEMINRRFPNYRTTPTNDSYIVTLGEGF